MLDAILATDLGSHADVMSSATRWLEEHEGAEARRSAKDQAPLVQLLLKCADISNPAKEWPLYKLWIGRLFREFHAQGDLEKQRGLAPANFMDRHVSCPPLTPENLS